MASNNINRKIFGLVLPAVVSNVTVPLLSITDTGIAGHLDSAVFLAAMAVGATMLNLSYWLFGFLRMGISGLTATSRGKGSASGVGILFKQGVFLGLAIGFIIWSIRAPLGSMLLRFLAPGGETAQLAGEYFGLCVTGAPAQLATMAIAGWMIGMESTFWPMVVAISTNLLNILLSLWLAFGMHLGFDGIALGTVYAQWVGLILALACALILWRKSPFCQAHPLFSRWKEVWKEGSWGRFFLVNGNLFFRSACVLGVSMGVTAYASRLGEIPLAANAVMMQFFTFFSFFMDGFAYAAETLTGNLAGAKEWADLKRLIRVLLLWSAGMAVSFFTIYAFFGIRIAGLITDAQEVIQFLRGERLWMLLIPPLSVGAFIFDGFYIGLTRTGRMLLATTIAAGAFFIVAWSGCLPASYATLWSAFLTYLFLRGAILGGLFPATIRSAKEP